MNAVQSLHVEPSLTRPTPRGHQSEAVVAVADGFAQSDRGQLIMACGTGKTYTSLWIKERQRARLTLVLVPSLGLIPKFRADWARAASNPFEQLCVCSDDTVGRAPEGAAGDELTFTAEELASLNCPVTSDSEEIRQFLALPGDRVIFSTYHSSPLIAQAQADGLAPAFDLVIADEAHRTTGRADSDFATVLDDAKIRATKRLFATATPRIYSSRNGDEEIVSMDNSRLYGEVFYRLSFGEAIRRGLLTDYRVVIIGVDNPMVQAWIDAERTIQAESGRQRTAAEIAAQIGVIKAIQDYDLRRVISFHSRVDRAAEFADELVREWGAHAGGSSAQALRAEHISGAMPADQRESSLGRLRNLALNERRLVSNVRCLSEGIDVPDLDGVVFADPRSGATDIVQTVGRAIRLSDQKELGTIVLPVFLGAGDTVDEAINASRFKPVVDVLRALKSHDDELAAQLSQMRIAMGRGDGGDGEVPKVVVDLPERMSTELRAQFDDAIRTHLIERATDSWEAVFGALLWYGEAFGHVNVPQRYVTPYGVRLGMWCSGQRQDYKAGCMPPERQARFEALPGWTWSVLDAQLETNFDALM
ncbi:MAG: DEAD/DEAH box helicase family protein, partial [Burkholderiales bacterium]|nr:DEAD/DEAH box helicase family protein [Burkholderiales bacterium]